MHCNELIVVCAVCASVNIVGFFPCMHVLPFYLVMFFC